MKNNCLYKIIPIIGLQLLISGELFSQMPDGDQNWDILFFDDFNSLNTTTWNTNPFPYISYYDYHWYSDNVSVSNSELKITTEKVGTSIHTGAVQTNNSFGFGYFEAKMKIVTQGSIWNNAFWLARGESSFIHSSGTTTPYYHPCCTNSNPCTAQDVWWDEIDIEVLQDYNITSNIHRVSGNCENNYEPGIFENPKNYNFISSYHTYAIEYHNDDIKFYLDNIKWDERTGNSLPDSTLWIIFNTGFINTSGNTAYNVFPGYVYVDWVKYYKLKTNYCGTDAVISNNTELTNFQYGGRRNITVGNGYNTISLNSGDKITFRASNNITINGTFTVPIGAELNLIPTPCD